MHAPTGPLTPLPPSWIKPAAAAAAAAATAVVRPCLAAAAIAGAACYAGRKEH